MRALLDVAADLAAFTLDCRQLLLPRLELGQQRGDSSFVRRNPLLSARQNLAGKVQVPGDADSVGSTGYSLCQVICRHQLDRIELERRVHYPVDLRCQFFQCAKVRCRDRHCSPRRKRFEDRAT